MRTLFFAGLLLSVLVPAAQESFTGGDCKAFFKYEVNNKMMFPYAATALNFYDLSTGSKIGFDVKSLRTGMYTCKMVLENKEVIVRKFIK
jgi:hypothetical protein